MESMNVIDLIKSYLINSYRKKSPSWGRGTMMFVKVDFILMLSAILSPLAVLTGVIFGNLSLLIIFIALLGVLTNTLLERFYSIYDDIDKSDSLNYNKCSSWLIFFTGIICIIISCQIIIYFYPQ
jgi:hypothetical protein